MNPDPFPAEGWSPLAANDWENGDRRWFPIGARIAVETVSENDFADRSSAGVTVTVLAETATVPAITRPSSSVMRIALPAPIVADAASIGSENWIANLLAARSYAAFSTCGPLQSTRTFNSAAGERLPSAPTTRTRMSRKP